MSRDQSRIECERVGYNGRSWRREDAQDSRGLACGRTMHASRADKSCRQRRELLKREGGDEDKQSREGQWGDRRRLVGVNGYSASAGMERRSWKQNQRGGRGRVSERRRKRCSRRLRLHKVTCFVHLPPYGSCVTPVELSVKSELSTYLSLSMSEMDEPQCEPSDIFENGTWSSRNL